MAKGRRRGVRGELNALREADRLTVKKFAPPGVLVTSELQVLQFRGETSRYLQPPTGKATFDVLKMAREGLMLPLRAAINKAKKENKTVRKDGVRVADNGSAQIISLEVIPLRNLKESCYLILFADIQKVSRATSRRAKDAKGSRSLAPKGEKSRRISELEVELSETRDYLQSIQEQYEATKEELQSFNEEVQSANEELQSINEELETSKEELESANEELTTVNEEMSNRNAELNRLNSDLVNLQTSTHLAIVLLSRDLTIRRFSVEAERQLNLLAADAGPSVQFGTTWFSGPRRPCFRTSSRMAHSASARKRHCKSHRNFANANGSARQRALVRCEFDPSESGGQVDGAVMVLRTRRSQTQPGTTPERLCRAIIRTARDPLVVLGATALQRPTTPSEAFKVSGLRAKGRGHETAIANGYSAPPAHEGIVRVPVPSTI
jgi:flagellar motility protein MotE (MotC chaperone)